MLMKIREIESSLGIPRSVCMVAYHEKGSAIGGKLHPEKSNSPVLLDPDKLQAWWAERCRMENKAMQRGTVRRNT